MSLLFRSKKPEQGAKVAQITGVRRFIMFIVSNIQQAVGSLGELWRTPFASLMTIAVLGLSLTLPATLYVVVKNSQAIGAQWDNPAEITVFLDKQMSPQQVQTFARRVELMDAVASVQHISRDEALREFREYSGFGSAIDYLDSNPLPDVLIVTPVREYSASNRASQLQRELAGESGVTEAKLDQDWIERLHALIRLIEDALGALALLLCVAVVLIVGNTIRLGILNRRDEIRVMKLVGATDGYIQRPFLYTGAWYGIIGGLIAWCATFVLIWWIRAAVLRVTELYDSQFRLQGLSFNELLVLWAIAISLGLLGSWIAVRRHVAAIEPR
ncbi:permease-like cell division protein FtsX [Aliidiomarina maris]|uniref:Cell division protein FtsX n=1 Tax=Aliidiomarina maris TaxID=531312 RepID=A0A327X002_9GAMM|nr:permease-like cell division protein FtsX [Aliidiomarina maris]RAJ99111.1 cell division protein FtsX [Aliidiomarina maris]RUO27732.1 cell division protein FtsX [Aliidiomarina maris]